MSTKTQAAPLPPTNGTFRVIPTSRIRPPQFNPRSLFEQSAHEELVASIREVGLLEPVVVRPASEINTYEIVAGERRFRACSEIGMDAIPAMVREELDDTEAARIALIENLARRDLSPIEEARGFQRLTQLGMSQTEIGKRTHRSQGQVANTLRLLRLPEDVQQLILEGKLTATHGLKLLPFEAFPEACTVIAQAAVDGAHKADDMPSDQNFRHWAAEAIGAKYGATDSRLGIRIQTWSYHFCKQVCEKCPYGARVDDICLKPDHYRELEAKEQAERLAKAQKSREAGALTRGEAVSTEDLTINSVGQGQRYVRENERPEGCSEACPCYRLHNGNPVCIDESRHLKLKSAATRQDKKDRRAQVEQLMQQFRILAVSAPDDPEATLQGEYPAFAARCLSVVLHQAWTATAEPKKAASEMLPTLAVLSLSEENRVGGYVWGEVSQKYRRLQAMANEITSEGFSPTKFAAQTIIAVAEARVRQDLKEWIEYQRKEPPYFARFVIFGEVPPSNAPEDNTDPYAGDEDDEGGYEWPEEETDPEDEPLPDNPEADPEEASLPEDHSAQIPEPAHAKPLTLIEAESVYPPGSQWQRTDTEAGAIVIGAVIIGGLVWINCYDTWDGKPNGKISITPDTMRAKYRRIPDEPAQPEPAAPSSEVSDTPIGSRWAYKFEEGFELLVLRFTELDNDTLVECMRRKLGKPAEIKIYAPSFLLEDCTRLPDLSEPSDLPHKSEDWPEATGFPHDAQPPILATYIGNKGRRRYRITGVIGPGKYQITDEQGKVLQPVPEATLLDPEKFKIVVDPELPVAEEPAA